MIKENKMKIENLNRISDTKQNLMDAYWQLYSSNIPGKITVKMITDKAGYNRGTFYSHFLDIDDLQRQIEDELLPSEEHFERLKKATFSKNSHEIVKIFTQTDKSIGKRLEFLLSEKGSLSFQNKMKAKLKELIIKFAKLDLNEKPEVLDYKATILRSIIYETITYWYTGMSDKRAFSGEELAELMLKIIKFGIGGKKT